MDRVSPGAVYEMELETDRPQGGRPELYDGSIRDLGRVPGLRRRWSCDGHSPHGALIPPSSPYTSQRGRLQLPGARVAWRLVMGELLLIARREGQHLPGPGAPAAGACKAEDLNAYFQTDLATTILSA